MSDYFKSLVGDVRLRYIEKCRIIDNIDPYTLKVSDFNRSLETVPGIHWTDIYDYFVLTHSYYTNNQFKAVKSLQAFKYYESGFIKKMHCTEICEKFLIVVEVKHSQRMNDKPLIPWLIISTDSSKLTAHCTCLAGLGENCSHSAALAFEIFFKKESSEDSLACTDKLSTWNVPRPKIINKVDFKKISEIDWGKSNNASSSFKGVEPDNISTITDNCKFRFLQKLDNICSDIVTLSVHQPFASHRKPEAVENLPVKLPDLYDSQNVLFDLEDLQSFDLNLSISLTEQKAVELVTRKQSKSLHWHAYQAGRITASSFKSACTTSTHSPSLSLLKKIFYPTKAGFQSASIKYGIQHEDEARKEYTRLMKSNHQEVHVNNIGLVISLEDPAFAASPDGIISCKCCGSGCIEIKCPARLKNMSIEELANLNDFLIISNDGKINIKKSHSYFYQINLQMYVTNFKYCDFIVWSKKQLFVERVPYDEEFFLQNFAKAKKYHQLVIVPELLSRCFTAEVVDKELWCICQQPDDGQQMVRCLNEDCNIKFFHLQCVGLLELQDDTLFLCQTCNGNL